MKSALLVIDLINDFDFPGGDELLRQSLAVAPALSALLEDARLAGRPVIYANDNFGRWRSDFRQVIAHCCGRGAKGRPFTRQLLPRPDDYFVLKPRHSAFFSSSLEALLQYLEARRLYVAGIAGDGCVQCTAADAHMRDYEVAVVGDCTASITPERNRRALDQLHDALGLEIATRESVRLALFPERRSPRRKAGKSPA